MSMDYRPHLLVAGVTGARVNIPRGYTSEQWEDLQKRFVNMVYPRTSQRKDWALWLNGSYALYEDQQRHDVYWHEELAGPRGMSFTLLIMPSLQLPAGAQTQHDAVVLTNHTPGGDNDQYFHLGHKFAYIYTHHAHLHRQQLRLPYEDTADDGRLLAAIFNASALGLTKEGIDPYPLSAVRHACMNYHNVSGGDHMDDAKAFASLINS